jgi:hypothetical protein
MMGEMKVQVPKVKNSVARVVKFPQATNTSTPETSSSSAVHER